MNLFFSLRVFVETLWRITGPCGCRETVREEVQSRLRVPEKSPDWEDEAGGSLTPERTGRGKRGGGVL